MHVSTIGLLAFLTLTSAKQNKNPNDRKKIKVKVQGKLLSANTVSDGNTCYPTCTDVFSDRGCEVMNGADYSLGTFYCKVDTPCAHHAQNSITANHANSMCHELWVLYFYVDTVLFERGSFDFVWIIRLPSHELEFLVSTSGCNCTYRRVEK